MIFHIFGLGVENVISKVATEKILCLPSSMDGSGPQQIRKFPQRTNVEFAIGLVQEGKFY